jgi:hypothetical protein
MLSVLADARVRDGRRGRSRSRRPGGRPPRAPARRRSGGLADLILDQVDVDLPVVVVDSVDNPGRQHALFAEDPDAGIDDDIASADVVGGCVDVADGAIRRRRPGSRLSQWFATWLCLASSRGQS